MRRMKAKVSEVLHQIALRQAAHWYTRLRAPDCTAAERQSFQEWLRVDVANVRAYQAAVRTAEQVAKQAQQDPRLRALADMALQAGSELPPRALEVVASEPNPGRKITRPWSTSWRLAAALVGLGLAALIAANLGGQRFTATPMLSFANNSLHEQEHVLSDGSRVHLDAGAEVSVVMSADARLLELSKGRAYFEVAHDKSRPFSVTAAGTRTVALGTRFEVALQPQGVSVSLAEGAVSVSAVSLNDTALNDTTQTDDADTAEHWQERLAPGEQLQVYTEANRREKRRVDVSGIAGWLHGRLVFDGMPLATVLDEFNRYAATKVYLGDPKLASIPIGGNFIANGDSNEFVATLTAVLPLRSVRTGANEILLFERYDASP